MQLGGALLIMTSLLVEASAIISSSRIIVIIIHHRAPAGGAETRARPLPPWRLQSKWAASSTAPVPPSDRPAVLVVHTTPPTYHRTRGAPLEVTTHRSGSSSTAVSSRCLLFRTHPRARDVLWWYWRVYHFEWFRWLSYRWAAARNTRWEALCASSARALMDRPAWRVAAVSWLGRGLSVARDGMSL